MQTSQKISYTLRRAESLRKKLRARRETLIRSRKALKKAGIVRGTLNRQEKRPGYFVWYLHVSTCDCPPGKRVREYLGVDPAKREDAEARIKRAAKFDELGQLLACVEASLEEFQTLLESAIASAEYMLSNRNRW